VSAVPLISFGSGDSVCLPSVDTAAVQKAVAQSEPRPQTWEPKDQISHSSHPSPSISNVQPTAPTHTPHSETTRLRPMHDLNPLSTVSNQAQPVTSSPMASSVSKAARSDIHEDLLVFDPVPSPELVAHSSDSDSPSSGSARAGSLPSSRTSHEDFHAASARKPSFNPPLAASADVGGRPPQSAQADDCPWAEFEWEKRQPSNLPIPIVGPWDQTQNAESLEETRPLPGETLPHLLPAKPPTGPMLNGPWGSGSLHQNHNHNHNQLRAQSQQPQQRTAKLVISRPARGPKSFQGGWDDLFADVSDASSAPAPTRVVLPPSPDIKQSSPASAACEPTTFAFKQVAINKHGDRLDLPLPSLPEHSSTVVLNRAHGLCNEHHLRGACDNAKCRFEHGEVDEVTLLALRHLARTIVCPVGRRCRRSSCYGGHHCRHRPERRGSRSSESVASGGSGKERRGSRSGDRCWRVECRAKTWKEVRDFEIAEIVG
jgi:hypothetical protein